MPKLYSSEHVAKILRQNGFYFVSQKGSHSKFRKDVEGKVLTVIVPTGRREEQISNNYSSFSTSTGLVKAAFMEW